MGVYTATKEKTVREKKGREGEREHKNDANVGEEISFR